MKKIVTLLLIGFSIISFKGYAQVITYSETFYSGVTPTTQCTAWDNFRSALVNTNCYTGFTIKGSQNTTGITCTDPVVATAVANALNTGTQYTGSSNGQTWSVYVGCTTGSGCNPSTAVELTNTGSSCNCNGGTNSYTLRPAIGNSNWGGISGNTCSASTQTMTVEFYYSVVGTPPTITCPTNITINNDAGNCGAIVNYNMPNVFSCGAYTLNQTAGLSSGSTFPVGTTINTFTATNSSGTSTCSFNVTVIDAENPTITCTPNLISCDSLVSNIAPITADNCPGESVTYTLTGATIGGGSNDASGTMFNTGVTTVKYIVTDASGNQDSCSFTVEVLPQLTSSITTTICNDDSVVVNGTTYNSSNPSGTEVFTNVGPNNCDSTVTISLNVLPALASSITTTICNDDSVVVNGTTYNSSNPSGTEVFTNVGPNNCDSTVTISLNVLPALTGNVTSGICDGDSLVINGTIYNASNPSGTEVFTNVGANNCDSTVTISLTINPLPNVLISSFSPDTICANNPAISVPVGTPANGVYSGNGVSGNMFDPSVAGVGGHYVVYTYTDTNTCTNSDSTMIVVNSCVGIGENNILKGINIYPNPTNGVVNIDMGSYQGLINYELVSVEGKVIQSVKGVSNKKIQIDLGKESKGIYLLKLYNAEGVGVHRIIKE